MMQKAHVFIASSKKSLTVANALKDNLMQGGERDILVWDESVFRPSSGFLECLSQEAKRSDFGIFIFAHDDELLQAEGVVPAVRDNVLFEFGLFAGEIGFDRCFIVVQKNGIEMRIPSDLGGLTLLYWYNCNIEDYQQCLQQTKPAAQAILSEMHKKGIKGMGMGPVASSPFEPMTNDVGILFHCGDVSKYLNEDVDPTGDTLKGLLTGNWSHLVLQRRNSSRICICFADKSCKDKYLEDYRHGCARYREHG